MLEVVVWAVILAGLHRKPEGSWSWSRQRLRQVGRWLLRATDAALSALRRSLPRLMKQCGADLRILGEELLGSVDPKVRGQIERRARGLITRRTHRHARTGSDRVTAGGAVAAGGPGSGRNPPAPTGRRAGDGTYARLQRRYLEGRISLEEYLDEARRLRS